MSKFNLKIYQKDDNIRSKQYNIQIQYETIITVFLSYYLLEQFIIFYHF
jgi:hypothetical protein